MPGVRLSRLSNTRGVAQGNDKSRSPKGPAWLLGLETLRHCRLRIKRESISFWSAIRIEVVHRLDPRRIRTAQEHRAGTENGSQ